MVNMRMKEKLSAGEAIDVSKCKRSGNDYILTSFHADKDYCDADLEHWIWSIGCRKSDGAILASTTTHLYQNPDFECLWLR